MDGERGRGVGVGLPLLRDDLEIRLSQFGGGALISEPLNSNAKGPWPVESSGSCTKACPAPLLPASGSTLALALALALGVEPIVLVPPLKLFDDVRGRPREFRFRSLEVEAEAVWGSADGVIGMLGRG